MTVVNNDIIKAVQKINMPDSVVAINVFYFEAELVASQTDQDVVDAIETWMENLYDNVASSMDNGVSLGEMPVYRATGVPIEWELIGTGTPTKVGTQTDDMLPHGVSALTRAYSSRSKTIARKYIPGFSEATQSDGDWVGGTLTALGSFNADWAAGLTLSASNYLFPGVWSTVTGFIYRLTSEFVILAQPAYQRRRRPGVGI